MSFSVLGKEREIKWEEKEGERERVKKVRDGQREERYKEVSTKDMLRRQKVR